ncbi:MAG TPA: hypothetical protein VMW75_26030 [Thermoanaerobaculia bacterium]|nr:hypothetical protein [Thermoanaerobaculia bacterium]
MDDPRKALSYALEKYPHKVELIPMQELVIESARQNPKRPAYVKLAVPDEVVKSLKGATQGEHDLLLLVRVPREVLERAESRIILPGEVA